jgi:hypothetical protein
MPVTIKTATHAANIPAFGSPPASSPEILLKGSCSAEFNQCKEVIQSSFDFDSEHALHSSPNGFVHGVVMAYSSHQHLLLKPEDIWFAILTQLTIYINQHAEELRGTFVAHSGKKELEVIRVGNRYSVDHGPMAEEMARLLEKNVVDPELRRWVIPAFTTTSKTDEVVASILMMGALQKYFTYKFCLMCGIPSVTLLGERADWEEILGRLEKLQTFGKETTQWYHLLKPVLSRFVKTFDTPHSPDIADFWAKIVNRRSGSGVNEISGWLTAFCLWDEDGRQLYNPTPENAEHPHESTGRRRRFVENLGLSLDGQNYGGVEMDDIPRGYATVPIQYDDNGYEFDAVMVAGSVGIKCSSSGEVTAQGQIGLDTLQAESGWWMCEKKAEEVEGKK